MPERPFRHALLTRFNLPRGGRSAGLNLDAHWLEGRFQLFERYALPAVLGQTNRAFSWFVLCDARTPAAWRERLAGNGRLTPLWYEDETFRSEDGSLHGSLREVLARWCEGVPWLITTRLDSDDAVTRSFVESVQSSFRGEREFINFTRGYWISLDPQGRGRVRRYQSKRPNPFISLIEPAADPLTAHRGVGHRDVSQIAPVRNVSGGRHFAIVAHGGKLRNRLKLRRLLGERREASLAPDFSLNLEVELRT